jgi:hypothetical protein
MMIDDVTDELAVLVEPEVIEYPLFTLYLHQGREIALSFKTREYRHGDLFCNHLIFALDYKSRETEFVIDNRFIPNGREDMLSDAEFETLLYLFRNANAKRAVGVDLYLAIKNLQNESLYVLTVLLESDIRPDWLIMKEPTDDTADVMVAIMKNRNNIRGSFEARYLIPSDPPETTDDLDVAMLESIKVGRLPIDLEA